MLDFYLFWNGHECLNCLNVNLHNWNYSQLIEIYNLHLTLTSCLVKKRDCHVNLLKIILRWVSSLQKGCCNFF